LYETAIITLPQSLSQQQERTSKKQPTVSHQTRIILSQLLSLEAGRKSHQLIQSASALSETKLTRGQWMNLLDALVHRGLLSVDQGRWELILAPRGRRFLREGGDIYVDIDQAPPILPPEVQPRFDETLYGKLRWKRKELADKEGVPVYKIFTNRSLAGMAAYRPESLDDLQTIHGIGDRLSAKYGQTFLTAIQYYLKSVA
tara:strand:- start:8 stop:610 length:603 start_codon:yes stop_codon:yes gene_type:complete